MSSSMRNFMEAYAAVHNHEAKEEMTSSRDAISEMNLSPLTDNDLNEIVEEVLEDIFESGFSVNEAYNIFADMFVESNIEGRQQKIDRLCEALNYGFELVESKASTIAIEEFRKHRHGKKLQETWSDRLQQDKRVKKQHSAVVAAESLNVKNLLIQLFNEEIEMEGYKGKHGQSDKEYADSRSSGGKMVSGDSKMSGAEYTHGRRVKAANPGMQSDVGGKTKPKSQGKMDKGTRADITFRKAALKKAALKKEEVEQLDEISKKTMGSYVKKASKDVEGRSYSQGSTDAEWYGPRNLQKDKKIDKRQKGIGRAVDKMTRKEELEEVEQLDEAPYQVMGSPDGKKEKKIGKPVKSRKYADSRAAELSDTHKTTGGQYRSKYVEEVDEAMRPGPRQRAMAAKQYQPYKKGGGTYSSRDKATAHNVAVRNDGPGTPGYEKKSTGGKGARYAGYGDQGAGNKARRRMGEKPMRGNRDPRKMGESVQFSEAELKAFEAIINSWED